MQRFSFIISSDVQLFFKSVISLLLAVCLGLLIWEEVFTCWLMVADSCLSCLLITSKGCIDRGKLEKLIRWYLGKKIVIIIRGIFRMQL